MHSEVAYVPGIVKQILKSVFQDQNVTKLFPPEILFVGLMIAPLLRCLCQYLPFCSCLMTVSSLTQNL